MKEIYFSKYKKYASKNKLLEKFLLTGGYKNLSWFIDRTRDIRVMSYDEAKTICMNNDNAFSNGGHSTLYKSSIPNTLIRIIPRKIADSQNDFYQSEIDVSSKLSNMAINNVNPHFPVTYYFLENPDGDAFQLIEKFDGDIVKVPVDALSETGFFEQMLIGLYTLLLNDIVVGDVKRENILYMNLESRVTLKYYIADKYYLLTTNVIYVFADFGRARKFHDCRPSGLADERKECLKNISDLNSLACIHEGDHSFGFLNVGAIEKFLKIVGSICGFDFNVSDDRFPIFFAERKEKYLSCIKKKLDDMSSHSKCFKIGHEIDPAIGSFMIKPNTI